VNTAQRLGYRSSERLLIVNADDFGLCRSVNEGVTQLLADRAISSTTIMMNCSWASDAVTTLNSTVPDADIGVHWTLTSEWAKYRWGSVCRSRATESLCLADGTFPATVAEVERRADPEEVRHELIAQTEAALAKGLNLTHADNHMGSVYGLHSGNDLLPVAFDVCETYGLPFRLPRHILPMGGSAIPLELEKRAKIRVRQADDRGIVLPDYLIGPEFHVNSGETYEHVKAEGVRLLRDLLPGVTEWISHPSKLTDELLSFHTHASKRGMELVFWQDPDIKAILAEESIRLIGWKELQELQASQNF
jgi:chitin disaccharide deacetylase